jgi:metal-responsive CopG/Arc/MetJ family transcriptional regulator
MPTTKVAISLDSDILRIIDELVKKEFFPNRSKAIQEAVEEKIARLNKSRLAMECSKLDPKFEQAMADEGISMEIDEWPEY